MNSLSKIISQITASITSIQKKIDSSGELDEFEMSQLGRIVGTFADAATKHSSSDSPPESLTNSISELLPWVHAALHSMSSSFRVQKTAWQTQLKSVRRQAAESLTNMVGAMRVEHKTSITALHKKIEATFVPHKIM